MKQMKKNISLSRKGSPSCALRSNRKVGTVEGGTVPLGNRFHTQPRRVWIHIKMGCFSLFTVDSKKILSTCPECSVARGARPRTHCCGTPVRYPPFEYFDWNVQSRLKCSISLESFNLASNFQLSPSEFPAKKGPWWVTRLKFYSRA